MDLLVNPTIRECKQPLLTSDVHEGPLPHIVHGVALCRGDVDRQHNVVFNILEDQVVHHNVHVVYHAPDQTLHVTCQYMSKRMREILKSRTHKNTQKLH